MTADHASLKNAIHDYLEGNLTGPQEDRLWAELLGRPEELEYLETLAVLKKMGENGAFDDVSDSVSAERPPLYHIFRPYIAAAAVLLIGLVTFFQVFDTGSPVSELSPVAAIEYNIERSSVGEFSPVERYIQQAVSHSSSGDITQAMAVLEEAREELNLGQHENIELGLTEGAILYNSEQYTEAIQRFESVRQIEGIGKMELEKSLWYLANAQIRTGELESAKENIKRVIELDGAFSRVATRTLNRF